MPSNFSRISRFTRRRTTGRCAPTGPYCGREASGRLWVTVEVDDSQKLSARRFDRRRKYSNRRRRRPRLNLSTDGGDISAGISTASARLDTKAADTSRSRMFRGDLISITGGGHITTGTIGGSASCAPVEATFASSSIAGMRASITGGGNVTLEHSGSGTFCGNFRRTNRSGRSSRTRPRKNRRRRDSRGACLRPFGPADRGRKHLSHAGG